MLAFFVSSRQYMYFLTVSYQTTKKKDTKELKNLIDKTYFVFTLQISINIINRNISLHTTKTVHFMHEILPGNI